MRNAMTKIGPNLCKEVLKSARFSANNRFCISVSTLNLSRRAKRSSKQNKRDFRRYYEESK